MSNNLNEIFELYHVDEDKVVIKVKADSTLKVAMFPFVSMEYEYITVTRGRDHVLTVVYKNGKTFDFHWGFNGHTLISEGLTKLKKSVLDFINDTDILLEYNGGFYSNPKIFYNSSYHKWQFSMESNLHYWSNTANSFEDMAKECLKFVEPDSWTEEIAVTGITVWKANNPRFCFR